MNLKESIVSWLDSTLVPEWRKALKMFSVQSDILLGALATIWLALGDEERAALAAFIGVPPAYILIAGALFKIYLRLKEQPSLADPPVQEKPDDAQP